MSKKRPTVREIFVDSVFSGREERLAWEKIFFYRLRLPNGVFKATETRRLDDVNQRIMECIRERWFNEIVQVLDVAVSSGITTMEFANAIRREGRIAKIVGIDICIDCSLLSYRDHINVLCNSKGQAFHFEILGYPIANFLGTGWCFWRRSVPVLALRGLFQILKLPAICRIAVPEIKPIRLLTQDWRQYPEVAFVEEDLFSYPTDGAQYHIIRAANVLNPQVFSAVLLSEAIKRFHSRLKRGGYLVIVRSDANGVNNGACFELQSCGIFRTAFSFGSGCEIESLVLGLTPHPPNREELQEIS